VELDWLIVPAAKKVAKCGTLLQKRAIPRHGSNAPGAGCSGPDAAAKWPRNGPGSTGIECPAPALFERMADWLSG
jgi:hypothetical protein